MKVCNACLEPFSGATWTCPTCGNMPATIGSHLAFSPELAVAGSGFNAEHFAKLARNEERNFWFRSRNHLLVWAMRRYFPKSASFFELGCGNGYVLMGMRRAFPRMTLAG